MIAIIGAGLSGLSAARTLVAAGRNDVCVLESSELPGGRVRTLDHEGFRLDRGFQVALESYPAIQSEFPSAMLRRCYFGSGALVEERPGTLRVLANPLRHPSALPGGIVSALPWSDRLRLLRLTVECLTRSPESLLKEAGRSSASELQERGFSKQMMCSFFEPFFGGVFLDARLDTDFSLLRYYLKQFALGRAFVPQGGMGRLGEHLADSLPGGTVRYGTTVRGFEMTGDRVQLRLGDGGLLQAKAVILAADPGTTCQLLGWQKPTFRDTRVLYFSSAKPLYDGPWIVLPSTAGRVAQHFVQLTNADPSLAPDGQHLLSATVLDPGERSEEQLFACVKQEVARLFPASGDDLRPLRQLVVRDALPDQAPGFRRSYQQKIGDLPPPVFVAGDLASNASLQNALESGQRAAERAHRFCTIAGDR